MKVAANGDLDLSPPERLRIRWLVLTAAMGAGLVTLAVVSDIRWEWKNILPNLFLECGVAVALVSVLFLLERQFVERVRGAVQAECTLADPPSTITKASLWGGALFGSVSTVQITVGTKPVIACLTSRRSDEPISGSQSGDRSDATPRPGTGHGWGPRARGVRRRW